MSHLGTLCDNLLFIDAEHRSKQLYFIVMPKKCETLSINHFLGPEIQ